MNKDTKNSRLRCLWSVVIVLVIVSVVVCVVGYVKVAIKKSITSEVSVYVDKFAYKINARVESIGNEVSRLSNQIESLRSSEVSTKCIINNDVSRQKWKVWTALRSKLESGKSFDVELKEFNETFSDDNEILDLVKRLTSSIEPVSSINSHDIIGICKKIFKNFIKLKKINRQKLDEVSGYVLSSDCNCNRE